MIGYNFNCFLYNSCIRWCVEMADNQFLADMGNRISKLRKELRMTQEQVAEAMNISIQSLSCIELGKKAIRPENLCKLCNVLNTSSDYVLMGKKSTEQLEGISKKIANLHDDDYLIIENLVEHLNKKNA